MKKASFIFLIFIAINTAIYLASWFITFDANWFLNNIDDQLFRLATFFIEIIIIAVSLVIHAFIEYDNYCKKQRDL